MTKLGRWLISGCIVTVFLFSAQIVAAQHSNDAAYLATPYDPSVGQRHPPPPTANFSISPGLSNYIQLHSGGGSGSATNITGAATNQVAVIATNVVNANTIAASNFLAVAGNTAGGGFNAGSLTNLQGTNIVGLILATSLSNAPAGSTFTGGTITNDLVVTNAGTATGVTVGTNGSIGFTGNLNYIGANYNGSIGSIYLGYSSADNMIAGRKLTFNGAGGLAATGNSTGSGSNSVVYTVTAVSSGVQAPNGEYYGGYSAATFALVPLLAYQGVICTNGYSAMWSSNGATATTIYMRVSTNGSTTWVDKVITSLP